MRKDQFNAWKRAKKELEALAASKQEPQCRTDGRCQYAIDHGAEGLGHCPPGKCAMPEPQAQAGEPRVPPLPEGKAVVRGPVSAFNDPESGTLVDFDCEGPLSHCPEDGEELFTADQVLDYSAACLQSHREAMEAQRKNYTKAFRKELKEFRQQWSEADAKKDAALKACVEALEKARQWHNGDKWREGNEEERAAWEAHRDLLDEALAAITQAEEAMK